jgi:predicted unusual protein kinase regulating ubiquinone biosynthesis (AarF/ABC1/UbiB family)
LFLKALKPKKLKETIFYLGASFIKLAQVLATRSDFFSKEYLVTPEKPNKPFI